METGTKTRTRTRTTEVTTIALLVLHTGELKIVSKSHQNYFKPCVESNGAAQMQPRQWHTIWDCSRFWVQVKFSIAPHKKCMLVTVAHARKGNVI